jgi:Mg2+-importing ATPase
MTIASDDVDSELIDRPRRWDTAFIRKFMITFGLVSSIFDYLTFGVLLFILHAGIVQFQTGWFLESVISASLIALVIRTRRPVWKSKPGKHLLRVTLAIAAITLVLPYTPLSEPFGFSAMSPVFLAVLGGIVLFYILGAEGAKKYFYKKVAA